MSVLWAVLGTALTPVLAFLGAGSAAWAARRWAGGHVRWGRREQTMRLLRWAADKALDERESMRERGLDILSALLSAEILQPADQDFVKSIMTVLVRHAGQS